MNKGIHSRGYLPHWDFCKSLQAVTFRLADSVPAHVINQWKLELADETDKASRELELHRRIARFEDTGHGEAILREPELAEVVQAKLVARHPECYRLIEWCIMPNHVHVLFKLAQRQSLGEVVRAWKGGSATEINRRLNRSGRLWMMDYYDRFIRDQQHLDNCRVYIRNNPVKAGLCEHPQDWPFSSARLGWNAALTERGLQSAANPTDHTPGEFKPDPADKNAAD
jgi:REP element-mobilizing transposase RayT